MYIQHFHNFRMILTITSASDLNHNKCIIANTCVRSIYGVNEYLYDQINSPKIRTIFTKSRMLLSESRTKARLVKMIGFILITLLRHLWQRIQLTEAEDRRH